MEHGVLEEVSGINVPLIASAEIGVRWDGCVEVLETDAKNNSFVVKGKERWYEETLNQLKKSYVVEEEELSRKSKVESQSIEIVGKKSYQGEDGGIYEIKGKWTLRS